jgi:hypothetical protein
VHLINWLINRDTSAKNVTACGCKDTFGLRLGMNQFFVMPATSAAVSTETPTQLVQGYKRPERGADNPQPYVYTVLKHEDKHTSYTRITSKNRLSYKATC